MQILQTRRYDTRSLLSVEAEKSLLKKEVSGPCQSTIQTLVCVCVCVCVCVRVCVGLDGWVKFTSRQDPEPRLRVGGDED